MNRFNLGNIATNGMQILSVGATTAARTLGRAENALNNLSEEEKNAYYKMKADKMRNETSQYNSGGASAIQHLSEEELTQYRQAQADDMRKNISGSDGFESIDDVLEGGTDPVPDMQDNSPQVEQLKLKMQRDKEWYDTWIKGKSKLSNKLKSEIRIRLEGVDADADV